MMSEPLQENSALQILIEKKKNQPIRLIHWLGSGPSYMISAGKQPEDVRSRVCKRLMTVLSNLAYG